MGRKKKEQNGLNSNFYFGEKEEKAVIDYNDLSLSIEERNEIFEKILYKPLRKMVTSIVRKYPKYIPKELGDGEEALMELEQMAFYHTFTNINKYKPGKLNKKGEKVKAYSYLGTICRNWVKNYSKDTYKKDMSGIDINELHEELEEDINFSYELRLKEQDEYSYEVLLKKLIQKMEDIILHNRELKTNEIKVGEGIILIFDNWSKIIENEDELVKTSNFFTKKKVFEMLKNITNLSSKDIRSSLKVFKDLYFLTKEDTDEENEFI